MKKLLKKLAGHKDFILVFFLVFLVALFFVKTILHNLVPIPADLIVGIYYPWRDYIWPGFPAGVPFKNGLLSDVVSIIYPWRIYGMELLKAGKLPLWIPHALAGQPLLANFQSAVFYPFNFLFFIFRNIDAWTIYIILQPLLASLFSYFFLKSVDVSKTAAVFGSLIFAYSGFNLVWLEYGIIGHAGLWLPLILLAVNRLSRKVNLGWFIVGAVSVAFSLLAGYPQVSIYLLLVAFFFNLSNTFKVRNFYSMGLIITFIIFGILLSGIQLVPGWELVRNSIRNEDVTTRSFDQGYIALRHLILFFFPDFYGNPSTQNFWGSLPYNEVAGFIGVSGLVFALYGFLSKRHVNFFRLFLLFSMLVLFKPFGLLIQALKIPGLAAASVGRTFFLADFFLAVLAAFGFDEFIKSRDLILLRKIIIWLLIGLVLSWFWVFKEVKVINNTELVTHLKVSQRNMILPTAAFFIVMIIIFITDRFPRIKKIAPGFLILLLIFELFRFGWKYNSFSKRDWLFPNTDLIDYLKQNIGIDRFVGLIPQGMFIPYHLSSVEGYEPLMIRRYNLLANQVNETDFTSLSVGSRWVKVNNFSSSLVDLLGVRYILADKDWYLGETADRFEPVYDYGRSKVYLNEQALPRVFLVHDYQVIKDEREIIEQLRDEEFDPLEKVILEKEIEGDFGLPVRKKDIVLINQESYWQNEIVLEVETDRDGILFVSDNFYPGWRSFVDNQETETYRANFSFRGIIVPAGKHRVDLLYRPESVQIGTILSCLGVWLLLTVAWCWQRIGFTCSADRRRRGK
ncbi:MAG TPA: YfhO family protein [Candidatus Bathyarchaeia archaeon]|nr:YfhO family protein [Candidatus Bathyarchaeia archaeon]